MINIEDLYKKKKIRENTRSEIYEIILKKCHNKIYFISNNFIDNEYTYFDIPKILIGYPLFNRDECSKYLINQLIKNGFMVKYLGNGLIFICWKKREQKKISNKSVVKEKKENVNSIFKKKKFTPKNNMFRCTKDIPNTQHLFINT